MLDNSRLHHLQLFGAVASVLTITAIIHFTDPMAVLRSADARLVLPAGLLSGLSVLLWSGVWVYVLARSRFSADIRAGIGVSMASNVGMLTPLNIGTDLLRSLYGKKLLGLAYNITASASVVTRIFKLHVTLALLGIAAFVLVSSVGTIARSVFLASATVVLLLGAFHSLRSGKTDRFAHRLGIGDLSGPITQVGRSITAVDRLGIYLAFGAGFIFEWLSLHMCVRAIGQPMPPTETLTLFALLYALSRTPVIPQGLGLVEVSGFAMLASMNLSAVHAGAILLLWDTMRILVPLGLALVFSLGLGMPRAKPLVI